MSRVRRQLSRRYLAGEGIEIGALHLPLALPAGARARYVDRMSVADLRRHYPEMAGFRLLDVDIIDNGETLATLADASVDFVIANHFIEHTEDPLRTIANHLRVIRPGGILFLAVPDKRHTFDIDREVTSLAHVIRDHEDGPAGSRPGHYEEWVRHVEQTPEADVGSRAHELDASDYSIHFHAWTADAFLELLRYAQDHLGRPFSIEESVLTGHELVVVLRRTGASHPERRSGA